LVTDLIGHRIAVIAAVSGTPAALAAKAATETIPIVFVNGGDPIASGLVSNLSRPAKNVTGVTFFTAPLPTKRLELLRQLAPEATTVGVLVNPVNPPSALEAKTVPAAARTLGMSVSIFNASTPGQIDETFAAIARQSIRALYVSADPLFFNQRNQVIALAIRHSVVATYADREIAEAGGLVSYGASRSDAYRQGGVYVGRILKGEQLGALPVMLPTKYELILNLKTAKALNLSVPWQLQQLADEVIE
jgi:putative ABC transport system substrate-binding protein